MTRLTRAEIETFWSQGYVVASGGATAEQIAAMKTEVAAWVEESRGQPSNYGETVNGKARFDLEAGHSAASPRLRRVSNPCDISDVFLDVIRNAALVDMVADLIGPDVKFHHCKLNIKLARMDTHVGYHQDHPFDPHTNDDVVVTLLMLDDMTRDNGCTYVVPGSHRGERYTHYRDGRFVGEIPRQAVAEVERRAVPITGRAGDVCLMHTWMVHGGPPNRSDAPRALLICDYTAADAFPLTAPAVPGRYTGEVVRGEPSRVARLKPDRIELPPAYEDDSFFGVQGQETAGAGE